MPTVVKSELTIRIANRLKTLSPRDVELGIKHILDEMSQWLADGLRIEIRGFGSFSLHYRPPRDAHNPKTGVKVATPGKYSPHFKPGKALRERVNESRTTIPVLDRHDDEDDADDAE